MKTIFLSVAYVLMFSLAWAQQPLTEEERTKALDHLKKTRADYLKTIKGLSDEQINFKLEGKWSIAECAEHISATEHSLFSLVEMALKKDPDPSLRSEIKFSDDEIIAFMEDRERKVQTRAELEPSDRYEGFANTVDDFKTKRKFIMDYIKSTEDDLRNRYFDFPFGKVDAYQIVLFLSAHVTRHNAQIREVMDAPGYPGS